MVEIIEGNNVSGVHVRNLFLWNSVMLALDDGTFVEYVHIKDRSVTVPLGGRVRAGQQICQSGEKKEIVKKKKARICAGS